MSARTFLDTNVVVYAFDRSEPEKRGRAIEILGAAAGSCVVSTQVLQEFYVVVTRKLERPLREDAAEEAVRSLSCLHVAVLDASSVLSAIETSRTSGISLRDALIVQAARQSGCTRLLSEDLQDGRDFGGLVVENPFA
ncbi:MAG: PIN domain-containing protein [Deltaproteobacteria bacterium]|nr:PIN domain-containing protein [Deltaproteobacteria bacterium]